MQEKINKFKQEAEKVGLIVNENRTKILRINIANLRDITIGDVMIERQSKNLLI